MVGAHCTRVAGIIHGHGKKDRFNGLVCILLFLGLMPAGSPASGDL